MAVVKTFDLQDFIGEFRAYGRMDNFTEDALELIFNHMNESEETIEMDVVYFCCEFIEQSCADILESNYKRVNINDDMNDEELVAAAREYLNANTSILGEYVNNAGETVFVFVSF